MNHAHGDIIYWLVLVGLVLITTYLMAIATLCSAIQQDARLDILEATPEAQEEGT
jgi:hypothetical protein